MSRKQKATQTIGGIPVVDATKPITLKISANDIKKGANKNPGACAAALACLRQIKGIERARVHIGRTYILKGGKWQRYLTPLSLRSEIVAFDRGGKFQPGEYVIKPLAPSHRSMDHHKVQPRPRGLPKKKRPYHITTDVRARGANR